MKWLTKITVICIFAIICIQNTYSQTENKSFEGFILKVRPHYPLMSATANFNRYFVQTETRIKGHHGIGINADYLTTTSALATENSELKSFGAGLNYRFVFKKDYFVNSFYINSALLFRNFDIKHTDNQLGIGTLKTYGMNMFFNAGHQWYFFNHHLQVAVGFGVDANFLFNNNVTFNNETKTIKELDVNEGAPFFPIAPDFDITIGWKF